RIVYMDNTGRIQFALNVGQVRAIRSPAAYRDDAWHHVVATVAIDGMRLYVGGELVASRPDTTSGRNLFGYWRIGDSISGLPNAASVNAFTGWIDEVAIYPYPMTPDVVAAHYALGSGEEPPNVPPVAEFTATTDDLSVEVDATSSVDH